VSPKTLNAQLFTIVYSLIAIASMMLMLKKVGNAMADSIIYLYSRCVKRSHYVTMVDNNRNRSCIAVIPAYAFLEYLLFIRLPCNHMLLR
jgi:hypothetical protein